jgi:L-alanine-DL-glutamate epimerase-like enolase superfamily enzyme
MQISSVDLYKANIPLKDPFKIAVMEMKSAANVFVRVTSSDGIQGWGESSPFWKLCGETQGIDFEIGADLARQLKARTESNLEELVSDMDSFLKNNSQIRAAFDMALHDLAARSAGIPLCRMLGGSSRPLQTCLTIAIGPAQQMAEKAAGAAVRGFSIIKIKLGTTVQEDIERVRAIREAVGSAVTVRVDANQGWDVPAALSVLDSIAKLNVEYCEQPVQHWNLPALKRVHDRSPVPIVADESVFDHHDALKVMSMDAADYVNIKLSKSGGIRTAQKIAAVVEAAGKSCMIGCMMESRLGLTAAAHLACSMKCFRYFDLDSALLLAEDPIKGGMRYEKDQVILDDSQPGLGVCPDERFLAQCQHLTI